MKRAEAGTHPSGEERGFTGMATVSLINPRKAESALTRGDTLVPSSGVSGGRSGEATNTEEGGGGRQPVSLRNRLTLPEKESKSPAPWPLLLQMRKRKPSVPGSAHGQANSMPSPHTAKEARNPAIWWHLHLKKCSFGNKL